MKKEVILAIHVDAGPGVDENGFPNDGFLLVGEDGQFDSFIVSVETGLLLLRNTHGRVPITPVVSISPEFLQEIKQAEAQRKEQLYRTKRR